MICSLEVVSFAPLSLVENIYVRSLSVLITTTDDNDYLQNECIAVTLLALH